jgi:hypothetical protein
VSDTIHHQADPPGVTWDLTIDGQRYLVIEDAALTDCGHQGSREANYSRRGCRCDTCRAARTDAVRRRRQTRKARP